jgi:bifunctional DNA-binding transcriptional regulator/antitoxin component of YhaV-PrlF toxin-antitoxin module
MMREAYPVEMDSRGHIVIPASVRKEKGFGAHTLFMLVPEGDELRLVPCELHPRRKIRMYSNEEIAQALIDGAVTPTGIEDARQSIRELGLDPDSFQPNL